MALVACGALRWEWPGPRINGQEPPLFAVDDAHVGPLYCNRTGACRGNHAIMLDHGNQVYSIDSNDYHGAEARIRSTPRATLSAGTQPRCPFPSTSTQEPSARMERTWSFVASGMELPVGKVAAGPA